MPDNKYQISNSQIGAVGDGAVAHHFTQSASGEYSEDNIDSNKLAEELEQLIKHANSQASDPEHQVAIGKITAAKAAADQGDTSKAIEYLRSGGAWVRDVMIDLGAKTCTEIVSKYFGI